MATNIVVGRELCRHCLILSHVLFGPALYSTFQNLSIFDLLLALSSTRLNTKNGQIR